MATKVHLCELLVPAVGIAGWIGLFVTLQFETAGLGGPLAVFLHALGTVVVQWLCISYLATSLLGWYLKRDRWWAGPCGIYFASRQNSNMPEPAQTG